MKNIAASTALLLLAGCVAADARSAPLTAGSSETCPLAVSFGSYAMGIDQDAFDKTKALLAHDRGVTGTDQRRWGREGEVTLCVQTRSEANARRLARKIKAIAPAKPRGPISITTRGGLQLNIPRH